jgi:hypothetical protein
MSATITGNPIVVAAADASSTAIFTNPLKIKAIVWDSGTSGAVADQAVVQDKDAKAKWSATLAVAKDTISSPLFVPPLLSHGLLVPTLSHGTLYIYLDGPVPKS